jgi:hypothetical protein
MRERQAENGVERDPPVEHVQRRPERDRAEDDEGDGVEHLAAGVDEIRGLTAVRPVEDAEDQARHEGGDEAAAAERGRDPIRERRCESGITCSQSSATSCRRSTKPRTIAPSAPAATPPTRPQPISSRPKWTAW